MSLYLLSNPSSYIPRMKKFAAVTALIHTSFSPSCSHSSALTFNSSLQNKFSDVAKSLSQSHRGTLTSQSLLSSFSSTSQNPSENMSCARLFQVVQFPCLSDNYGYLIHSPTTGETAAIDTPDAATYERVLLKQGWTLTHILNTHHHWDHVGGNEQLKNNGVQIIGPVKEKRKIPGIDVAVGGGDVFSLGGTEVQVLDVGGHTRGHVAYYFPNDKIAFVGDALFALGCGRMFEGTPGQFWSSLKRLRELPDDTVVYCAHEYTESNAKFAMSVEPGNEELVRRVAEVKRLRKRGEPTVPSVLGEEKVTNPFLRVDVSEEIRNNVGASDNETHDQVFAKVRMAKDNFRG